MKRYAVFFMEFADKSSDLYTQYFFHRAGFRRDYMHVKIARAERCGYFKTDETGTNHYRPLRCEGRGDNRAAVSRCAQIMHMWKISAGHIESNRLGTSGEQQRVIGMLAAIDELYLPACCVNRGNTRAQLQINVVLLVEFR